MDAPPLTLDPSTLASFLVGTVLPLLIAWLQSYYATSRFKAAFSFAVCVGVALLVTVIQKSYAGSWGASPADNLQLIALNVVALLMSAWSLFARLYQPLGLTQAIERRGPQIGRATTSPLT